MGQSIRQNTEWGLNNTIQKSIGRSLSEVMLGVVMNSEFNAALNEITEQTHKELSLQSIRNEVKCKLIKHKLHKNVIMIRKTTCAQL